MADLIRHLQTMLGADVTFREGQRGATAANVDDGHSDGDDPLFTGDEDQLADFVEDDMAVMNLTSLGSFSYDTQVGGNTTVPIFEVEKITRKGSCD